MKSEITGKARDRHLYLKRFENDWATADLIKQFMRNRRKYLVMQEKKNRNISNRASLQDDHGNDDEGDLNASQGIESDQGDD